MTAKEKLKTLIDEQPDNATYDDILRELAFARMVDRGLADVRAGRTVSNEERLATETQRSQRTT